MATQSTVHVKNIASSTSDKEVKDFFSFCGKIADFQVTAAGETKDAEVTFEKETAMKTALLLNNTQLGPNQISVASASGSTIDEGSHYTKNADRDSDELTQEEKPRARILAEYLAHGYVVGDVAIERAIDLDAKHGVSNRFVSTLQGLDQKYHATDRAKATDQSYGISHRANNLLTGISSYFEKASNTPTGQKLVKFYTDGSRQVQDIHNEARRLADLKKEEHGGSAYKAAGLERVFGKEKEKPAEGAAAAAATTASSTGGAAGVATTTPAQTAPTEGVPAVNIDEAKKA
ncbi:Protein vip1 [Purpureocillium takamizusanense]|uniref:Protein vip1 n=1 Tax=Purpureocillium takamizusanense TaxID=2060973 RepID=A0A9Q8VEW6_9HYPO|nr:Protein vip1 [Purpureocillium takamizusanense]UNI22731.1 Protein vip1 [Purpureocillium takamizusanense]